MDYTQILIKPIVSEKATFVKDASQQVAFYVNPKANKIEIRKAVEAVFNVKVSAVNVLVGKPVARSKQGRVVGQTTGYKKAYVTLAAGEKIDFFEGV